MYNLFFLVLPIFYYKNNYFILSYNSLIIIITEVILNYVKPHTGYYFLIFIFQSFELIVFLNINLYCF